MIVPEFEFEANEEFNAVIRRLQAAVIDNPDEHYPVVRASDVRYLLQLLEHMGVLNERTD